MRLKLPSRSYSQWWYAHLKLAVVAGARRTQAVAAVQADVVEGAQASVALAHDQHRLAADFRADVVAGLAQVLQAAAEQPDLAEDPLPLEPHELRRGVALLADEFVAELRIRRLLRWSLGTFLRLHPLDRRVRRRARGLEQRVAFRIAGHPRVAARA